MKEIPALLIKNLQILNISQPKLTSILRRYADSIPSLKEPVIQETPSGRWISGFSEKPFFEKKSYLEKREKISASSVFLVFGAGCAPYLFQVLRSLPREALSVTVFEPSLDALLYTLAHTSVFHALPPGCRISFIVNNDRILIDESVRSSLSPIGLFPVNKAFSIYHEGELESCDFQGIEKMFREEILYLLTVLGNSPEDTLLGVRHGMLNLPRILKSPRITELAERYKGLPFICVAAGPSLDKNIDLLLGIEKKSVIIACDTVLFKLLERGIMPHIVTSIERPYVTYEAWVPRVLQNYGDKCKEIILVSQSVSYPLTAGRWPGPNIIVGKTDVPTDRWLVQKLLGEQLMASGLSVAHMNLAISVICQASAIALVGQDLAYAEDGHSHADNTVHEGILKIEQKMKQSAFEVEGALGKKVLTSGIWHTFIQIMERTISLTRPLIFDCTEGGALIAGTKVEPLFEFIKNHVSHRIEESLAFPELSHSHSLDYNLMFSRFEEAFSQLEAAENLLVKIRDEITRAVAPALTSKKRQVLALGVSEMLDEIRDAHPAIAFIGQSYTHLSGAALTESRFLESVEQVKNWEKTHLEILASHSVTVHFLKQWLSYAFAILKMMQAGELPDWKTDNSNGEEVFMALFSEYAVSQPENNFIEKEEYLLISELLSCKDPLKEDWSPDNLWKAARFLNAQGRNDEARRLLERAYKLMEDKEMSISTIGAFFKDWGSIAGEHDLCVIPDAGNALLFLSNAARYLPDDEEINQIKRKIINQRRKYFKDISEIKDVDNERVRLLSKIADAEKALVEKDLISALSLAEQVTWESAISFPETSLAYLNWLMKTAANCTEAADAEIVRLSDEILGRIIARLPDLVEKRIEFPVEFLSYLNRRGIKFSLEASDNHTEVQ